MEVVKLSVKTLLASLIPSWVFVPDMVMVCPPVSVPEIIAESSMNPATGDGKIC